MHELFSLRFYTHWIISSAQQQVYDRKLYNLATRWSSNLFLESLIKTCINI